MTQWYVKELSKLANVSVQTLHHYDRIGLLVPSIRMDNGYRLYSETDLLKLQQTVALKFFGFKLSKIKELLEGDLNTLEHFNAQASLLKEKANTLLEASQVLKDIVSDCNHDESIPWKTIIKSMEIYRMTQELENTWAANVLTPEELKQYASFEADLKNNKTQVDRETFSKNWKDLVAQVTANLEKDPSSTFAIDLGGKVMTLINGLYGKKHANLRHSIWHKGFMKGKMNAERALEPEVVQWLDQAISAYYKDRAHSLLEQVEINPTDELKIQWEDMLHEMCGDSKEIRRELYDIAMKDPKISPVSKEWLKQFS